MSITFIMRLTEPMITLPGNGISGRDLILLRGRPFPDRRELPTRSTRSWSRWNTTETARGQGVPSVPSPR